MLHPLPGHYVRARFRAPTSNSSAAEHARYKEACEAIAHRLLMWAKAKYRQSAGRQPSQAQLTPPQARGIAAELVAAVRRAKDSAPLAAEVWKAYVALYAAMRRLQSALEAVAALPEPFRYIPGELTALNQHVSSLAPPVESTSGEQAALCTASERYSFQKRQRGRLKAVRVEIVRQTIAVWLHRFHTLPPATPEGVFDEVLKLACEYHGMDSRNWPGHIIIRTELAALKKRGQQRNSDQLVWRFYPGRAEE